MVAGPRAKDTFQQWCALRRVAPVQQTLWELGGTNESKLRGAGIRGPQLAY